eukprot:672242-Alexandrium_andersonii.AAC.1
MCRSSATTGHGALAVASGEKQIRHGVAITMGRRRATGSGRALPSGSVQLAGLGTTIQLCE